MNIELEKLGEKGTISWLHKTELGIILKGTKLILLTIIIRYKRDSYGEVV